MTSSSTAIQLTFHQLADQSEDVHGAPTTIQLVARSYQDEELIAASRVIDECVRAACISA